MKNLNTFTLSIFFLLFSLSPQFTTAQSVAVVGYNGTTGDGYTIVALEAIPGGTKIYFSDKSYSDVSNAFLSGEGHWSYTTPAGGHAIGDVITFEETGTSTNVLMVACNSTCGTFLNDSGGSISLASDTAEGLYAYTDSDNDPTNGITTIHAVLLSGGNLTADENPSADFPDAIVVDGFSLLGDHRQYTVALRSEAVTKADLENPANYDAPTTNGNVVLSTVPFTNIVLTEPLTATATASPEALACNGDSNSSILVEVSGGTPAYTYTWNNAMASGSNPMNLPAGTYCVTVTDMSGGSFDTCVDITEPMALIAATVVDSNTTCNLFSDGGATAFVTGGTAPYNYLWSNSATTASITGIVASSYNVTLTDANGCQSTSSVTITEPAALAIALTSTEEMNSDMDGTATASVTGGTAGYSYLWDTDPVQTTSTATGLSTGTYSVMVTDANGCETIGSIDVGQMVEVSFTAPTNYCINDDIQTGIGSVTPMGGVFSGPGVTDDTNGMTYTFNPAEVEAGTHTITYTFGTENATITIEVFNLPEVSLILPDTIPYNGGIPPIGVGGGMPEGGVYSDFYNETTDDGNGMTFSFDTLVLGFNSITYTFTDQNGCTASASQDIDVVMVVGLNDPSELGLDIFPNPTSGKLEIRGAEIDGLEIFDNYGRMIRKVDNPVSTIDISDFPNGMYFLKVRLGEQVAIWRVVKE
jgi:hypothetical protein